ncbi:polysaccharide export protein [Synechococcus sp. WH 8016]|nr:polysaccharide export protein [Synechococcus sp. WH 8016]
MARPYGTLSAASVISSLPSAMTTLRPLALSVLMAAQSLVALPAVALEAEPINAMAAGSNALQANRTFLEEDAYIIGPGDVLELRLFDSPELSGQLEVLNDGSVPLPLIGSVRLTGLTLQQATVWVKTLMGQELLRPDLQLRVVKPRPIRVALVGQVERPGIYSLSVSETVSTEGGPSTSVSGLPTVVDAIQKAGGITQKANLRDVQLQRRLPGETPQFKQARLNLLDLILEGNQSQNPYLFDGDTVRLGKADETPEEAIELASMNLSPQVIGVNVIGEVVTPGRLQLQANTPLVQAVLAAGGAKNWRANRGNVELVRINRNGSATLERFKIDLSQGASNEKNPPLRDGDTVKVNRSGLAKASDAIGAVSQPLSGLVTIWTLLRLVNDGTN